MKAASEVDRVMNRVRCPAAGPDRIWAERVLRDVAQAHERFRIEEDDPDGYGSATFRECRAAIEALASGLPAALGAVRQ